MKTSTKIIIGLSIALVLTIWVCTVVITAQGRIIHNNDLLHQADLRADSLLIATYKAKAHELDSVFADLQTQHIVLINRWTNYKAKFKWTVTDTLKDAELQKILVNKIEGKNP